MYGWYYRFFFSRQKSSDLLESDVWFSDFLSLPLNISLAVHTHNLSHDFLPLSRDIRPEYLRTPVIGQPDALSAKSAYASHKMKEMPLLRLPFHDHEVR